MAKTNAIDPNVPAGSEDPKLGDNRIRKLAAGVAEEQNVDHYMGTDGGAGTGYNEDAAGEHKKVTLRVQTSKPTAASGKGFIYAKTVSGVVELFYEDQAGKEVQITANGILNSCNLAGDQTVGGKKTFSDILTVAKAIVSTLAEGTAPLTVASATKVANLNADKVDGFDIPTYTGGESFAIGTFIIKRGTASSTSDGAETFNFAVAFPNSCLGVWTCRRCSNPAQPLGYESKSKTGFVINRHIGIDGSQTFDWLAIGY